MRAKRKRQIKRTEAEWKVIFRKFTKSGLAIKDFCVREGLVLSTFKRWQQNLSDKLPAQFVDMSPTPAPAAAWELEVKLPNGVHLQFRG